jgi:hypothetical protein
VKDGRPERLAIMPLESDRGRDYLRVQAQIRANAEEMQDYLRDLQRWEKDMTKRDGDVRKRRTTQSAPRKVKRACVSRTIL